jgi:bifunctional non-homologous end joining protein LigD
MMPHVAERPLTLVRCPEGIGKECFFQKHASRGWPDLFRTIDIKEKSATREYLYIEDASGLVAAAQMGVLELHVWGARGDDLDHPDRMVFDLDPDEALPWRRVTEAAREIRKRLEAFDLKSWVKTTGGKGLHVVAPLIRRQTWEELRAFSEAVAAGLEGDAPDRYTSRMAKAGRRGKIFVDYLRNSRGATAIAAYSTRARSGAPVSMPISWDEIDDLRSGQFTIKTVPERLARQTRDPWRDFWTVRQCLTREMLRRIK